MVLKRHAAATLLLVALTGCGTTKSYTATDQLLMSDAVDATVAKLDFSPLAGKKVYLDATYVKTVRSPLLIESDYVISSLRQQMVSAGVLMVDGREDADIIAEARLGALGLDGHNVVYGIPATNALSTATAALTSAPILPQLPEISLARREAKSGAAKIAVFAYLRETREPYWQSGIAKSTSNAKDIWILGVGPFQRGSIYDRTQFAGSEVAGVELLSADREEIRKSEAFARYHQTQLFAKPKPSETEKAGVPVLPASVQKEVATETTEEAAASAAKPAGSK